MAGTFKDAAIAAGVDVFLRQILMMRIAIPIASLILSVLWMVHFRGSLHGHAEDGQPGCDHSEAPVMGFVTGNLISLPLQLSYARCWMFDAQGSQR